jgi:hypothetical protein
MISFHEFKDIFKDIGFEEEELKRFYYSIKKSLLLRYLGKRSWQDLIKLEEQHQWPVLQRITDPNISIYRGADKELLDKFMKSIAEEKSIRGQRGSTGKVPYWNRLRALIEERIDLFTHIFGFSKADIKHCEAVSERYSKIVEKRDEGRKKLWKIGIGAGAATLAGAAALWYMSKKEKE